MKNTNSKVNNNKERNNEDHIQFFTLDQNGNIIINEKLKNAFIQDIINMTLNK